MTDTKNSTIPPASAEPPPGYAVDPAYPQQGQPPQAPPPQAYPAQAGPQGPPQMYAAGAAGPQSATYQQFPPPGCDHSLHRTYGVCGIISAIVFFPIGLICLCIDSQMECRKCGWIVPG